MRLTVAASIEQANDIKQFADWMLRIGDGSKESNENDESEVEIPGDLLINDSENPLKSLVEFTYPNILQNFTNTQFYEERAILAPTLESVENVNDFILSLIPGCE